MLENLTTELKALWERSRDLEYLMIEAEGDKFFQYATELEHLEFEIEQKEQEHAEMVELIANRGVL